MSMKAIKDLYTIQSSLAPIVHSTTGDVNGTGIDLANMEENVFWMANGLWTAGTFTPRLQESDASGSGYADVAAADLVGAFTAITSTGTATATGNKVSYIGKKRYVRVVILGASSPNAIIGAICISKPRKQAAA